MRTKDIAIHVVVLCSLVVAIGAVVVGYKNPDIEYLRLLVGAVTVCLLAGILFVMERLLNKMSPKGITPIISVVLLLMMTVAIAGIAWFWLQGMTEQILNSTQETAGTQLGAMTLDLDFGSSKVYCSGKTADDKVESVSVFIAVNTGTNVHLEGILFNANVVSMDDLSVVKVGDNLGTGEYKEIKIDSSDGRYTGDALAKPGDSADFEVVVKTNLGKQKAILNFDTGATTATTCH